MKYERLFSPLTIRGTTIKNRVIFTGLGHLFTLDGDVTDKMTDFYVERALGGAGVVTVGVMRVDERGVSHRLMDLSSDRYVEHYKALTDKIHAAGALTLAQLNHQGRYARSTSLGGLKPIAPSAVYSKYSNETPDVFTVEEIHQLEKDFASAAVRAVKAGFDIVEICGSSGYLLSQFVSELTNQRTDEYGGSLENRLRFVKETYKLMREAVGENVILSARITGNDMMPGGAGLAEAVAHAKALDEAGVDIINVTGGWHESPVPQITGDVPRAGYAYIANEIKKNVKCYVAASNRFNYPEDAENVLAMGGADFICLCRVLLADPYWPKKAKEGKDYTIRHCLGCNQACLANAFHGKPCACIVNGRVGYEYLLNKKGAPDKIKKILVVGGGAGGMDIAAQLAERGHKVTLWEKSPRLGGMIWLATKPTAKYEFAHLVDYYEAILPELGVDVVLNKEATAEEIIGGGWDCVITATGGTPKMIKLPGDTSKMQICTAHDVLEDKFVVGKNVVILGGGEVGCETAEVIAAKSSMTAQQYFFLTNFKVEPEEWLKEHKNTCNRNITILEIGPKVGAGFPLGTSWPLMTELARLGVKKMASTTITNVGDGFVTVLSKDKDGNEKTFDIPCDTIVEAVGSTAKADLYEAIKDKVPECYNIGDSFKSPGSILNATRQATDLAYEI